PPLPAAPAPAPTSPGHTPFAAPPPSWQRRAGERGQPGRDAHRPPPPGRQLAATTYGAPPPPGRWPPGWYPDPRGRYSFRYFDGAAWTDSAFTTVLAIDPLPGQSSKNALRNFHGGAGLVLLALLGLVVPFALGALAEWAWVAGHGPGGVYALEAIFEIVLWSGLYLTCAFVSRRYGSGSLRWDYQVRFRALDIPIALVGAFVSFVLVGLVALLIRHLGLVHLPVSNNPLVSAPTIPAAGWIVLVVCTCFGAPLFEELYFRGLLQGLLRERVGTFLSVVLTAIVFAAGHIFNAPGLAGVAYAMEILPVGLVLCTIKSLAGRLGSTMSTHFLYNSAVMVVLAVRLGALH
ncbi:MAG TPA: CPBP family intramembrane glutamic endopeptidase, partial [Acidimicrobiales bacterium]|nr:CPBP family intramembrane glutamic endopeptidase [Acidimicrobiales bacterium]